jgi:hypothetical protein
MSYDPMQGMDISNTKSLTNNSYTTRHERVKALANGRLACDRGIPLPNTFATGFCDGAMGDWSI